mmetsp:Transcript_9260/g.22064  ORF Transcript_9260/g.22064 Transcript_9260/m.22064 type:complete len:249 (-) Transcript_9260:81-827(-)
MTTAHRPTWKAAVGQGSEGGWSAGGAVSTGKSVLDEAAHTKLKIRTGSQVVDRKKALRESLLKLEQAEKKSNSRKIGMRTFDPEEEEKGRLKLLKQTAEVDDEAIRQKYDDDDASGGGDDDSGGGWSDVDDDDLDASDSDEDDSDDEDDEAALQAELAKIRAEREEKKRKEAEAAAAVEDAKLEEAAVIGNPLLADNDGDTSARMKRKWNDDVVFRNQAKGEPDIKKRFINDTIRNDFHKRFLNKFIR